MTLLIRVVHITRCESLKVNQVAAFIGATDTLDLNGAGDLDLLARAIDDFACLERELLPAHFLHQAVEFLTRVYCLVLVYTAILGKGCEIIVIQDAWDNALSDHSVAAIVDYGCGEDMESLAVQDMESSETQQVVVCLGEGRVILQLCQVSEGRIVH